MKTKLNYKKMKQNYLNSGANVCPYCGSKNISAIDNGDFDDCSCWRDIECKDCEQLWTERFMMTDIEFKD